MKRMRLAALLAAALLMAAAPARAAQMEYGEPVLSACATDSYYKDNAYTILTWFCRSGDFTAPITRAEFCDMLFNAVQAISYGAAAQIDLGGQIIPANAPVIAPTVSASYPKFTAHKTLSLKLS